MMQNTMNEQSNQQPDDFAWLMSLALDDALSERETARFEQLVYTDEAELARQAEWQLWQHLDVSFAETPALAPAPGFAQRFEQRLASQARRQRLWLGAIVAVAAVLVWGLVGTAVVALGPAVSEGVQAALSPAVSGLLQNVNAFFASAWLWTETVGSALFTIASTGQVMTAVGLYALTAGLIVVAWVSLLRRTTGVLPVGTAA